jgi:hypothetical protein
LDAGANSSVLAGPIILNLTFRFVGAIQLARSHWIKMKGDESDVLIAHPTSRKVKDALATVPYDHHTLYTALGQAGTI